MVKIMGLAVLVIALALGVVNINKTVFQNSQAFDERQWAKDKAYGGEYLQEQKEKNPDKYKDKEKEIVHDKESTDPNLAGCTDKAGVCEPVECSNDKTAWKDCFLSEWKMNYTSPNGAEYKVKDLILYSYAYTNGDFTKPETTIRFTYPGLTGGSVEYNSDGSFSSINLKFGANGELMINIPEIANLVSSYNSGKGVDEQLPVPTDIFSFLNSVGFSESGGLTICNPSGKGACLSMESVDAACAGCNFSSFKTIKDYTTLQSSIEEVEMVAGGNTYQVTGYFPITGCPSCQQRYKPNGGGGNGGGSGGSSNSYSIEEPTTLKSISGDINSLTAEQFLYIVNKLPASLRNAFLNFLGWVQGN